MEILNNLDPILKTYWIVALLSTLIFIFQTFLTFLGSDASDGLNADFDGDLDSGDAPFQLFSFRNLINFLLGFSWSGISFYAYISNQIVLVAISFIIGTLFVYIFFLIIQQVQKLAEDNSFKMSNTIDKTAEVYLPIPAQMKGKGKVLISVNGSIHELEAMTENEKIETGSVVRVYKIESENILIVNPL